MKAKVVSGAELVTTHWFLEDTEFPPSLYKGSPAEVNEHFVTFLVVSLLNFI